MGMIIPVKYWNEGLLYGQLKNEKEPSMKDYQLIQKYLKIGKRPQLTLLQDYQSRCRKFEIVGESSGQKPQMGLIHVHCERKDTDCCVIIYASFNKGFAKGVHRLIEHLQASDYKGAILYRIGGWPNAEGGDLRLAHVPYAFKVCMFREAQRLGYKKILWLDSSILPLVSVNLLFKEIKEKGYFVMGNSHNIGPYMNENAAQALGVSLEESFHIPSCSAGLFGIDFSCPQAAAVLQDWYMAAMDPWAFYSSRSDQNALSIILYKHHMQDLKPIARLAHGREQINKDSLFLIERDFVH